MAWNGKIFVIRDPNGKYRVGITMQPEGLVDMARISAYDGFGPYPPTGFPGMITVDDIDKWMEERKQAGFSFTPAQSI